VTKISRGPTRLSEKTAIVTGASRGIGLAIAKRLVDEGARVCITARKIDPLLQAAAQFPEGTVICAAGKADDPHHRQEVLDKVFHEFGRLDILVNNAGINPVYGATLDVDAGAIRKIFDVNVFAALAWVRDACCFEGLKFATEGAVVNVSSVAGQVPSAGIGLYGVSKAALDQLTRTLAVELGPRVRVNAVAPAVVKTEFARALYEGKESEVSSQYPLGRLGEANEIAAAVAFLVSPDASWVTGQILNIDGGLLVAGGNA
jgi:NAD(P)-dependent dehydrogenase (short-subunit alcohol dehydrogenase family)